MINFGFLNQGKSTKLGQNDNSCKNNGNKKFVS